MLIAAGQHPKVIQARLGYASIRTTLDVYGHLFEGLDGAAADALDDTFRRSDVDSGASAGGRYGPTGRKNRLWPGSLVVALMRLSANL